MSDRLLDDAKRLVLAWPGRTVPLLAPMAFWWDGQHVWMSTPGDSVKARMLREDGGCALYVPPSEDHGDGRLLRGRARVFHPGDPVGLAIHGGFLAAAQAALMVKDAPSVLGYVVDAASVPLRFTPARRVLIRVAVDEQVPVRQPDMGMGIAPAIPTEVPPEVRRTLSGRRRIVLGTQIDGAVGLVPSVWGAGFSLSLPEGARVPPGTAVSAVLDHDPGFRPSDIVGLSLSGSVAEVGSTTKMVPSRVTWWQGFQLETVGVSASPTDTVVIPD